MWKLESQEHRVDALEFIDIARVVGVDPLELMRRVVEGSKSLPESAQSIDFLSPLVQESSIGNAGST